MNDVSYAFVQGASSSSISTASRGVTCSLAAPVSSGNSLFVMGQVVSALRSYTVGDNGSGTPIAWQTLAEVTASAGNQRIQIFYAEDVQRTNVTELHFTLDNATSDSKYAMAAEYSGLGPLLVSGTYWDIAPYTGTQGGTASASVPAGLPVVLVTHGINTPAFGSRPLDVSTPSEFNLNKRITVFDQMVISDLLSPTLGEKSAAWNWSGNTTGNNNQFLVSLAAFNEKNVVGRYIEGRLDSGSGGRLAVISS